MLKKFFNKRVHFIHCKYLSLLIYSSIFEIEYRLLISSIRERRKARYGRRKQLHFRHEEYYRFMPVWKRKKSAKNSLFCDEIIVFLRLHIAFAQKQPLCIDIWKSNQYLSYSPDCRVSVPK